jgi:hypothetical protein
VELKVRWNPAELTSLLERAEYGSAEVTLASEALARSLRRALYNKMARSGGKTFEIAVRGKALRIEHTPQAIRKVEPQ